MNSISRDCGEIWSRLFDHRPFLSGEILYFQEEFEVKRNDREVAKLFEVLEYTTELRDSQVDKILELGVDKLPDYSKKLNTALAKCNSILDCEGKFSTDSNLEVKREIRKSDWEKFEADMKIKCANVNKTFTDKERELVEFYADLEKKLHIDNIQNQNK